MKTKAVKQIEAEKRQFLHDSLTTEQKLKKACGQREKNRLSILLEQEKNLKKEEEKPISKEEKKEKQKKKERNDQKKN